MGPSPLQGLRGIASITVMAHHYIHHQDFDGSLGDQLQPTISALGVLQTSFFFLLSGYSLALGYGYKSSFNTRSFLQNRIAHLLPLYYLSNLLMAPIRKLMYESVYKGYRPLTVVMSSVTATSTWFLIYDNDFPRAFNGPTWTICTLWFFYLMFPILLPLLKKFSDLWISRLLVILYFIQLVPFLYWWVQVKAAAVEYVSGWFVTRNPFCRLPVFIMGMLGGIQTHRWLDNSSSYQDPNENYPIIHDIIPWGLGLFSRSSNPPEQFDREKSAHKWAFRTDFCFLVYLLCCIFSDHISPIGGIPWKFYAKLVLIHVLLTLIIGLDRSGKRSICGKVFSSWICQKLGSISFSVYIIHMPVWNLAAEVTGSRSLKIHAYLCLMGIVIFLAYIVHRFIETPARNFLRYKESKKNPNVIDS